MSKKLLLILAMALSAALIAAGCGDDDSTTSTSSTTSTTETTTDDTSAVTGTEGASADDIEAACQQAIEAQGVPLSDELTTQIEDICQEAATSNDPAEIQAATQQVCELVVKENTTPGDVQDQALKACETAGQ